MPIPPNRSAGVAPFWQTADGKSVRLYAGDAAEVLRRLPTGSVQCCVTSPPYYGLRDYKVAGQLGLEPTPAEFVARLVAVFREVRRVLHATGTCWVNLGDSYASGGRKGHGTRVGYKQQTNRGMGGQGDPERIDSGMPDGSLLGVPWRFALAMVEDGWLLRSDNVWCLSGGTWVYVKSRKGEMPMMLRDAARLDPATVKLWNGEQWTQVLGWSCTARNSDELELVLRSGERISCTPTHQFPTERGLLQASKIVAGDVIASTALPEPESPYRPPAVPLDAAWFIGLYLAEGSRSGHCISIAGHAKEHERWERVQKVAAFYGGSATLALDGNKQCIRVYGRLLLALLDNYLSGKTAKDKALKVRCWQHGNDWLLELLLGYLGGDGHWDEKNKRWRLGFARNYSLERDLRVLAARVGFRLVLNTSFADCDGKRFPTFRGEIRFVQSGHLNEKNPAEVIEIRKARCREVYDLTVEDDPHLFALASGVLTHNCKPAPIPESLSGWRWERCKVKTKMGVQVPKSKRLAAGPLTGGIDGVTAEWSPCPGCPKCEPNGGLVLRRGSWRTTRAHEYLFQFAKGPGYFGDGEPVRTTLAREWDPATNGAVGSNDGHGSWGQSGIGRPEPNLAGANPRSWQAWGPEPYGGKHYACFPSALPRFCILSSTPEAGVCSRCVAPWARVVERTGGPPTGDHRQRADFKDTNYNAGAHPTGTVTGGALAAVYRKHGMPVTNTIGHRPTCSCDALARPALVLDPFVGSGTTACAALEAGRRCWGIDLSEQYLRIDAVARIEGAAYSLRRPGLVGKGPKMVKLGKGSGGGEA